MYVWHYNNKRRKRSNTWKSETARFQHHYLHSLSPFLWCKCSKSHSSYSPQNYKKNTISMLSLIRSWKWNLSSHTGSFTKYVHTGGEELCQKWRMYVCSSSKMQNARHSLSEPSYFLKTHGPRTYLITTHLMLPRSWDFVCLEFLIRNRSTFNVC